jgi:hypothetical protein
VRNRLAIRVASSQKLFSEARKKVLARRAARDA